MLICVQNTRREFITVGMNAYIPSSSRNVFLSSMARSLLPWIHMAQGLGVLSMDALHLTLTQPLFYLELLHIYSLWDHTLLHAKECVDLSSSPSDGYFLSLTKNISHICKSALPPIFHPDNTIAVSPIEKVTLFSSSFSPHLLWTVPRFPFIHICFSLTKW